MDRGHRADVLERLPDAGPGPVAAWPTWPANTRLSEIAIITRAGPARMLGLAHKGHLGPGADGDVTIYAPDDDKERMFALPRYVIKAGEVVLDDGDLRAAPTAGPCTSRPSSTPTSCPRSRPGSHGLRRSSSPTSRSATRT